MFLAVKASALILYTCSCKLEIIKAQLVVVLQNVYAIYYTYTRNMYKCYTVVRAFKDVEYIWLGLIKYVCI